MLQQSDLEQLAAVFPSFATVSDRAAGRIVREAIRIRAATGDTIFSESSECGGFPIILKGGVRVARSAANGREILLYRVQPGEVCVLSTGCLLGAVEYPASGKVESDLDAILIPGPLFTELLNESPAFREMVFGQFTSRITHLMELVEAVAFGRLDQRLASVLVERGPEIRVTHQQLADELGSVREIASRILGDFEDRGLVVLGRGRIQVLDVDGLKAIAG